MTALIVSMLVALDLAGYAAHLVHRLAVPGSAQRYKAATAFYAVGWAVIVVPALGAAGSLIEGSPLFASLHTLAALYGTWVWKTFLDSDDGDNWFTRTGRKLRDRLRSAALTPAPSAA